MKSKYYEFRVEDWRFIVLDGNDVSFHAYPKDSSEYKETEVYYRENEIRSPKWNGAVGKEQMSWLKEILIRSETKNEKVVLFCHFPVFPADPHNLWNATEVIELIEGFPSVKAYINGHNHKGNYAQKNGIHFLTLKGMMETKTSAYSIIRILDDRMQVIGYGREKNRNLLIKNRL